MKTKVFIVDKSCASQATIETAVASRINDWLSRREQCNLSAKLKSVSQSQDEETITVIVWFEEH